MSMTHGLRSGSGITAQQAIAAAEAIVTSQDRIKQPMNAYILWSCDRRPQLVQKHPRMKPRDISKRMGEEWKLLTKTEKAPFLKEAERLKAVLLKEHPDYRMRKTKKDQKLAVKRKAAGQEDEEQQRNHNDEQQQKDQLPPSEQQHLGGEEEHLPNVDEFSEMTSSNLSSVPAEDAEQKIPSNEKHFLIDEQEQQQLMPCNEQEEQVLPSNEQEQQLLLPSNEQEEQLLPNNEQEQQQLLRSNDQELLSDVEVEVPYDGQQEQELQVPDIGQELVRNNNDVSGMLIATSNSSSAQIEDCQQQVAENVAQHQAAVSPSFEPEPQLQHLAEALPSHHTSAFSVPAARRGFMYTQYGQVPSQQQLGYPGWGYPVSHPPQNLYAASTNTGYHHLSYYPSAQCPAPPRDDSLEWGMSSNGEGKKTRQPRTTFSSLQLHQLKSKFQRNQKPTSPEEAELAASLGLTHIQVKTWFLNRRAEFKRMLKAAQDFGYGGFTSVGGQYPHQRLHQVNHVPASHHQPQGVNHPYMQMGQAATGYPNPAPTVDNRIHLERGFYEPRQFNPTILSNNSL